MSKAVWLIAGLALTLAGCSNAPEKPKPTALQSIDASIDMSIAWSKSLGADALDSARLLPRATADRVYAAAGEKVVAVDAQSGTTAWELDSSEPVSAGIAQAGDQLFWVDTQGQLNAATTQGQPTWSFDLKREVLVAPVVGSDRLLVQATDGSLLALGFGGDLLWEREGEAPDLGYRGQARAAPLTGGFLVPTDSGDVLAVLEADGLDAWRRRLSSARGDLQDLDADPVLAGDIGLVAGARTGLTALLMNNGQVFWETDIRSLAPIAKSDDLAIVVDTQGQVFGVELRTGQIFWRQPDLMFRQPSGAWVTGNAAIVVDAMGIAHSLDLQTGAIVGRTATPLRGAVSLSSLEDDVLGMDTNGRLVLIRIN